MPDVAFNSHRVELLRNVQQLKFITCWPPKNMRRPNILPTFIAFVCQLQVQSLQILTSEWFLVIAKQSKCHHPSRVFYLSLRQISSTTTHDLFNNFQPSSQTHQYSPIKKSSATHFRLLGSFTKDFSQMISLPIATYRSTEPLNWSQLHLLNCSSSGRSSRAVRARLGMKIWL